MVKNKDQELIDASGSLVLTGTELLVRAEISKPEQNTEVKIIDNTNDHIHGGSQIPAKQATGPRTELGRQRASRNAIKHGIFSEASLLKGEPRAQFDVLRTQLWEALSPDGSLEELLVDKLASLSWRYRRLLAAEAAEIRKSTEFLEWDQHNQQVREAQEIGRTEHLDVEPGLIWKIQNPGILERCLELLSELRNGIQTTHFEEDRDASILYKIYGEKTMKLRETLLDEYQVWLTTAVCPEEERVGEGYATPEKCKQNILQAIDAEIHRLKVFQKRSVSIESERIRIEILRQGVPDAPGIDRFLRYEASLERAFDRTLNQLERLQRLRLGQPVAPRLDVSIS
jgi:hypothetical protein